MDKGQQAAFINQNFQNMATFLQSNFLSIVGSGTVNLNGNATSAGQLFYSSVTHNLGYAPIPLVYLYFSGVYSQLPNSTGFGSASGQVTLNNWSWVEVDTTTLYINFLSGGIANWGTLTYKYYLLKETAS